MRNAIRFLSMLLALTLLCGCSKNAPAEKVTADPNRVVVTVNGEELHQSDYDPYLQQYLSTYTSLGIETADGKTVASLIEDTAMDAFIQETLIRQDMTAQGCYEFDDAVTAWLEESGKQAYANALLDVQDYLRGLLEADASTDLESAALTYAEGAGVSEQSYIDLYREQYAFAMYCDWLMKDCPITEEDVRAAYDAKVAESKTRFENDAKAFETAIASNEEVWYQPAGYRSVLQILLRAQGETEEEKLASVADQVEAIYSRLDAGEPFENLIREFGSDANFANEQFYTTGYSVHPESFVWEESFVAAAFAEEMTAPGCWSTKPIVSDSGVHILYYLKDNEGGPVGYNDTIREALTYNLYQDRVAERQAQRLEEISAAATVEFPKD